MKRIGVFVGTIGIVMYTQTASLVGTFQDGRSGWNMAAVSVPRGKSFQDAKLRFDDVLTALTQRNGTVVFNSAGGFIPKLASICLSISGELQLPLAVNM